MEQMKVCISNFADEVTISNNEITSVRWTCR